MIRLFTKYSIGLNYHIIDLWEVSIHIQGRVSLFYLPRSNLITVISVSISYLLIIKLFDLI